MGSVPMEHLKLGICNNSVASWVAAQLLLKRLPLITRPQFTNVQTPQERRAQSQQKSKWSLVAWKFPLESVEPNAREPVPEQSMRD